MDLVVDILVTNKLVFYVSATGDDPVNGVVSLLMLNVLVESCLQSLLVGELDSLISGRVCRVLETKYGLHVVVLGLLGLLLQSFDQSVELHVHTFHVRPIQLQQAALLLGLLEKLVMQLLRFKLGL